MMEPIPEFGEWGWDDREYKDENAKKLAARSQVMR